MTDPSRDAQPTPPAYPAIPPPDYGTEVPAWPPAPGLLGGGPAPPQPPSRQLAGWALALSFVPCLPSLIASVVFAILALARIRQGRAAGRGMAIASFVLVGCWLVVTVVAVTVVVTRAPDRDAEGRVTEAGVLATLDFQLGDCFDLPEEGQEVVQTVQAVPCDELHDAEIYSLFELAGGDYPGDETVRTTASTGCLERFADFVGQRYRRSQLEIFTFHPVKRGWETLDDREVACAVFDTAPVTGTLRGADR